MMARKLRRLNPIQRRSAPAPKAPGAPAARSDRGRLAQAYRHCQNPAGDNLANRRQSKVQARAPSYPRLRHTSYSITPVAIAKFKLSARARMGNFTNTSHADSMCGGRPDCSLPIRMITRFGAGAFASAKAPFNDKPDISAPREVL